MPPTGEQANGGQPKRRRKTTSTGNTRSNGNGSNGPTPLLYPVPSQQNAPETDDAFADPDTETVIIGNEDDETSYEPARPPHSAVPLRPLPGPTRSGRLAGVPTSSIPQRRTGQHTMTPGIQTPGMRPSRLMPEPEDKPRRNVHWLLPVGVGMVAMLLLWVLGSTVLAWGINRYDDLKYGYPRTYQTDAVVGHGGDNAQHPSHFIAVNLHGQAIIIEFPAGNPQHAESYVVPYYIREQGGGQGGDMTPVTVEFRDVTGDKKPDMIIHILFRTQDQTFVFVNDGTKFRPPNNTDNIHL